ncbi:Cuticle protein 8 [Eumeta japonica]|uniref:Cuticle protein 8 n=1 Tax=Eumeta variegata TaxID=151549 RepID=A0A4C1SAJ6_EUMVA|nr:Cuticle protein 8 [Eumeta japonica]
MESRCVKVPFGRISCAFPERQQSKQRPGLDNEEPRHRLYFSLLHNIRTAGTNFMPPLPHSLQTRDLNSGTRNDIFIRNKAALKECHFFESIVVAQRPPERMISKFLIVAVLSSILEAGVGSPAYSSSVKVQRTNIPSYVEYGAPVLAAAPAASPVLAQLAAAPVPSSYGKVTSCVSPCVIEPVGEYLPYGAPAPVAPAARIITAYQAPVQNIPVVYPKSDGSSYEYSYVVIDDTTGDQKSQYELSDGGVVRGQYSFVQPDGYVREVQYTADDVSGLLIQISIPVVYNKYRL